MLKNTTQIVPTPHSAVCATGCRYDTDQNLCTITPQYNIFMLFEQSAKDPLSLKLQKAATECDKITDQNKCNTYKPVAVDESKVKALLSQDLDTINPAVNAARCAGMPGICLC